LQACLPALPCSTRSKTTRVNRFHSTPNRVNGEGVQSCYSSNDQLFYFHSGSTVAKVVAIPSTYHTVPQVHEHVHIAPYACTCAVQPRPKSTILYLSTLHIHIHMQAPAAPPPRTNFPSCLSETCIQKYMCSVD
jgi:hypothetical protein